MREPKKRGRKPKDKQEAFQLEVHEKENEKSIYEKKIEDQLPIGLETLRTEAPLGIKKNSEGKNTFWFGSKAHLAVGISSQYMLQFMMTSARLNDGKAAISFLKGIEE
jgi:transposase